ncbi:MAG: SWIM zinc finger family protein [Tannerellaceae bacterium]|jgi:hypothetical protein|nr:SWIM zinc finger family protein [Tannerellaceae bacterium]
MNKIIELQEISPNYWKAKYRGNYGVYTIKIETDGSRMEDFSCSCPSDYYPCKHIPIVQAAIAERMIKSKKENGTELFEEAVRSLTLEQLQAFILRFGLHNPSFRQAVLLEFTARQKPSDSNQYLAIIRDGLDGISFDFEDNYDSHDACFEIDFLDQWLSKAREYMERNSYSEAILIAKACIEEYAVWLKTIDSEVYDYVSEEYTYEPFNILKKAYTKGYLSAQELLEYCRKEMEKSKYGNVLRNSFKELVMQLTLDTDPEAYLRMQDELFNSLADKTSYEAETILSRKIDFFNEHDDEMSAWKIVEDNIQIKAFRRKVIEKRIAENNLKEAKRLINDYIQIYSKEANDSLFSNNRYPNCWDEYLLVIARKENDTKAIRKISRRFIDVYFHAEYYNIYKSTFSAESWNTELENLIKHYQNGKNWVNSNVADILVEEMQIERLLAYLSKDIRLVFMEKYYKYLSSEFPQETLALFKKAIDEHMQNTGRETYENVVKHFEYMLNIEGGMDVVKQMIGGYETQYKNRKAMIEIFARFSKSRL